MGLFLLVARNTKHLAVLRDRLTALAPGDDMVRVHIFEILRLAAYRALAALLVVFSQCHVGIKLPGA